MSLRGCVLSLGLALALAAAPAAAAPQAAENPADVAAARELFVEGAKLADAGKWAEARDKYERSLALKRAAITLYSLGVAQKETGLLVEALETLRAFLLEAPTPATEPYQDPAKQAIASLEKRVSRIEIKVSPAGTPDLAVKLDGVVVPVAALDRPRLVNPGSHEVVASAKGYTEAKGNASTTEGGSAVVTLRLQRAPQAPAASAPAPAPLTAPATAPAPDKGAPPSPSLALPITLIAGGVAVLGAGVAVGLIGVGKASDAPTRDGEEADAARTQALAGDIVAGAGILTAGIGLVVLLASGSDGDAAQQARAYVAPGGAGIRVKF